MESTDQGAGPIDLTAAIARGRLFGPGWETLRRAGLVAGKRPPDTLITDSMPAPGPGLPFLVKVLAARSPDVITWVAAGAAQLGIVGKDVLLEREPQPAVQELADLQFGRCRISVAAPKGSMENGSFPPADRPLRVATRLPRVTKNYFTREDIAVEIIPLGGAVESAPALGLSDAIVDIVQTGGTLARHGLVEVAVVASVSARLIGSESFVRSFPSRRIWPLIEALEKAGADLSAGAGATDGADAARSISGAAEGRV